MFTNGLSVLTHLFILLLAFVKRLVEKIAEKMGWDIFKFKMNLYLGWKISSPLTSKAGDTLTRRIFSYFIILTVSVLVFSATFVSLRTCLEKKSNIDFVVAELKSGFASASQNSASATDSLAREKYVATLPVAQDVNEPILNSGDSLPLRQIR